MKLYTIIGTRPQFIKASAFSHAVALDGDIEEVSIHTGQHYDRAMSDIFFNELSMPKPKYNLNLGGQSHGEMTGNMLVALEKIFLEEKPDCVVVYGDTNSTLAGALAASKLHIPLAHIEAGLRSFNKVMPEEQNRIIADHLSDYLFCPTRESVDNLRNETLVNGLHVGDIMYDVACNLSGRIGANQEFLTNLGVVPKEYFACTIHRAENTDDEQQLKAVIDYLKHLASEKPVVLPLHPRLAKACQKFQLDLNELHVIDPLGYIDMMTLIKNAECVYTDSGGLQKEAYFQGVSCVTLRTETEWTETVTHGWNRLWTEKHYKGPRKEITDYGHGDAGEKILTYLKANVAG
ncbi:MAG: non-hydrolyzing UDP-N-acetylglucosamine 2-epimerase [Parvibaculales bacterium]